MTGLAAATPVDAAALVRGVEGSGLADRAPIGILVEDARDGCTYANPAVLEVLGLDSETVLGDGWRTVLHPKSRAGVAATLDRHRRAGSAFSQRVRVVRGGGALRWVHVHGAPLDHRAFVLTLLDVTGEIEAEQSLAKRAQEYRTLVELSDGIVVRISTTGVILYASPSCDALLGWRPSEIGGRDALDFVHPDDRAMLAERLVLTVAEVPVGQTEFRMLTADGEAIWFEAAARARHDSSGQVVDLVVNCRDIRERRTAAMALEASEERYRGLVDSVREVIFQTDVESRWTFLNSRWEMILGWPVTESLGRPVVDFLHPGDRGRHRRLVRDLVAGRREFVRQEVRGTTRDGDVRWLEVSIRLVTDANGNAVGTTGTLDDISERKLAEEELRRNEARFRALAQNASDMVVVVDPQHRIRYASPSMARLLGHTPTELFGEDVAGGIHHDDLARFRAAVDAAPTGGAAAEPVEIRARHHDGTWRWIELTVTNRLGDPAVDGIILNSHDITARREAEEALRHREARWRTLVQNASDSITVVATDGSLAFASPAAERLLGYDEGTLVGCEAIGLVHPDDQADVARRFRRLGRSGGVSAPFEYRLVCADGSFRYVESVANNLLDDPEIRGFVLNTRDVSERKAAEALVTAQTAILGMVAEGLPLEDTLAALTGLIETQLPGTQCAVLLADADGRGLRLGSAPSLTEAAQAARHRVSVDTVGVPAADAARRGEPVVAPGLAAMPIVGAERNVLGVIEVHTPMGNEVETRDAQVVALATHLAKVAVERQVAQDRLSHQALHDPLTGLPNRTLFLDRLGRALARARRRSASVAVLFLDLDRFKVVNDSLGHDRGDQLLVGIAERLERVLRPDDTAARFGGDEFTILCEGIGSEDTTRAIADRIAHELSAPFLLDDREVFVTASIGIAMAGPDARPDDIVRDADAAMYRAKELGKARHEVFDEAMRLRAVERLHTENALYRALERGELRLLYQPEISLSTGDLVGVEALIRWEHPERGLVAPAEFVPLAEETGLIVPIGAWAIREACRQAARWQDAKGREEPLTVWVNLSARQLSHADLPRLVADSLAETGARPEALCLEITESVLMADVESTLAALLSLHDLGIRLGIDDFGTGYSSLSYLQRFPVDFLKVDRSFVQGLGVTHEDRAIVAGVVNLGHALGLGVIAEGVETQAQLAALRDLECDIAQGFLLGRPGMPAAIDTLLERAATVSG